MTSQHFCRNCWHLLETKSPLLGEKMKLSACCAGTARRLFTSENTASTQASWFLTFTLFCGHNKLHSVCLCDFLKWGQQKQPNRSAQFHSVKEESHLWTRVSQLYTATVCSFTLGGQTCVHTHTQGKERPLTIQIPLWPVAELSKSTEECTNTSGYSTILQTTMKNQKPTEWSQFCHQVMTKLHLLYLIKTCYNWFLIQTNNPELWVSHRLTGSKPTNSLKWIRYHMGEESLTGPWSVWF